MLTTGTRWTRRVRASVKPMSRDGARVAFKQLEAIAKVEHTPGVGGTVCGVRQRIWPRRRQTLTV